VLVNNPIPKLRELQRPRLEVLNFDIGLGKFDTEFRVFMTLLVPQLRFLLSNDFLKSLARISDRLTGDFII
jgi:hypothetical protein